MTDIFNNVDMLIQNASQQVKGLFPDINKTGTVIFKPKEDVWTMVNSLDGINIVKHNDSVFQVSTYKNFPVEIGIGYYADNKLIKVISIIRDTNDDLYLISNRDGELRRTLIPIGRMSKASLNTTGIKFRNGTYSAMVNGLTYPIHLELLLFEMPPVFFVEFDTPLKAAVIGPTDKLDNEKQQAVTSKPNFFIKEIDE